MFVHPIMEQHHVQQVFVQLYAILDSIIVMRISLMDVKLIFILYQIVEHVHLFVPFSMQHLLIVHLVLVKFHHVLQDGIIVTD